MIASISIPKWELSEFSKNSCWLHQSMKILEGAFDHIKNYQEKKFNIFVISSSRGNKGFSRWGGKWLQTVERFEEDYRGIEIIWNSEESFW
jgi:hypothetical protein